MNTLSRFALSALALSIAAAPAVVSAQDDGSHGPPKVLVVNREFTKPGRTGTAHEKTEAAFMAAARANKAPFHYFALTSMTGADRALFFSGYASMGAWGAEGKEMDRNPALGMATDHAMLADGDMLSATDSSVWMRRDDLSLTTGNLQGARYMEIMQFMIKPGHAHEWNELVKMYMDGYKKVAGAHWTTYQQVYGTNSNAYVALTPLKDLSEGDMEYGASTSAFEKAMGADALKKMGALEAACVETEQVNLFRLSPKMSLVNDDWIQMEPEFWAPKTTSVPKKKASVAKAGQ